MTDDVPELASAIRAAVTAYGMDPKQAEQAFRTAAADGPLSLEELAQLFSDPELNPLPEAARKGHPLEGVLDVLAKLSVMLGRPHIKQTARELKALWSGRPQAPSP